MTREDAINEIAQLKTRLEALVGKPAANMEEFAVMRLEFENIQFQMQVTQTLINIIEMTTESVNS